MSNNAWETTSLTSLHPLTHFLCHAIILFLVPYNDVRYVVSQALLLARPEYVRYDIRYIKIILNTYLKYVSWYTNK